VPTAVTVVLLGDGCSCTPWVVVGSDPGRTTSIEGGGTIAAVNAWSAAAASRWLRPAAAAAVALLVTVLGTALGPTHLGRPLDAFAISLVVVAAAVGALARRWPVPALATSLFCTLTYYWLGYPTDSSYFVGLWVTAYLSGTAGARLRFLLFAAAIVTLFPAGALLRRPVDRTSELFIALGAVACLAAGQAAAEWRARADSRAEETREAEALHRIAEERLRIARDLHDVVSHGIAMINVQAGVAVHVMDQRPEEARAALLAIRAASGDALRDLRGILGLLRQTDEAEPLAPAVGLDQLSSLVESVGRAGVQVDLSLDAEAGALPASVDLTAYRIIQEALTNVVRHAPGAEANVTVRRHPDALTVEVKDDGGSTPGSGADGRQGAGQGLAGMRERVRAAGGSLETGRLAAGGFEVSARLPIGAAE